MEKLFLDNLVILVKSESLLWTLMNKSPFDGDNEFSISSLGPDNKTRLEIKFTDGRINFIKVVNKDLKIDKLLFRTNFPDQLETIGNILFIKFKGQFDELNKKLEMSEDEKWSKLSQTFDVQTIRDIKLDTILKK
jgi:hypothetical protein